jgi:hypothetical protein
MRELATMNRGNRSSDELPDAIDAQPNPGKKMTIPRRSIAALAVFPAVFLAAFPRLRALRWIFVATAIAAVVVAPGAADAARRAGAYDGTWNVVFTTLRGNCSPTNSAPFAVSGTRVLSAGGGKVRGGVSRSGAVSVRISVGLSVASGSGRLVGNSGAGRWSGIISGDRCGGVWQAARS